MAKHFASLCVCILLFAGSASAQTASPAKPSNARSANTCSIRGSVVKAGTGEALGKAGVFLRKLDDPRSGASTHTDGSGHFAIDALEPGRYYLNVERTGYVSQSYGETSSRSRGAILTLAPGHEIHDMLFRLVPWAVISGHITDENGEPIPGVEVQAMQQAVDQGKRTLENLKAGETNDLGEFRIYGLSKGRYYVRAQIGGDFQVPTFASNASGDASSDDSGYAPVYYPGTTDSSRASPIEVTAGQEFSAVDFTLIPVRTFRVRGHVFDATLGQPAKDCILLLTHRDPNAPGAYSSPQEQTNCENGTFEFTRVPPGSYVVQAISLGASPRLFAHALIEVDSSNIADVNVTFARGIVLTGRIVVEGSQALDFSAVRVWLANPEPYINGNAGGTVKPDGTLTIENVHEGNYRVSLNGDSRGYPPDFYMKDALMNGESVLDNGLTIGAGGARGPLEIVLSSAGARVDGTVTDENDLPSAGAVVALVPEESRRKQYRLYKTTTTDQYGKFILRGIAPGNYKLFSWRDVENNAWEDPDFLKPLEDDGAEITAEENGRLTIQLKQIVSDKAK